MIILIDNYDSFTYNLYQYLAEMKVDLRIFRNDKITIKEVEQLNPKKLIISPGPGAPKDAGISKQLITRFYKRIPILGVCLGHQCIAEVFGGRIIKAKSIMHGKTSSIHHDQSRLFKGLSNPFVATRYHSLCAEQKTFPECLKVTARTADKEIMALEHIKYPTFGVQFHPESILTTEGKLLLKNFVRIP